MDNGRFSIEFLDTGDAEAQTPGQDVQRLVSLAKVVEACGFTRLWLAEHQAAGDLWGGPEIPMTILLTKTKTLAIGTAGVLIRSHNVLRLASAFCFLEHSFPGRIDLGIARGTPTAAGNKQMLDCQDGDAFESLVVTLVNLLRGRGEGVPINTFVLPQPTASPRLWLLGSGGGTSYAVAKTLGVKYIHGYFFQTSMTLGPNSLRDGIAVAGFCSPSKHACQLFERTYDGPFRIQILGDAAETVERFHDLAAYCLTDRIIFLDLAKSRGQRARTVKQLARELAR